MSLDRSIQTFSISLPTPPSASVGFSLFMTSVDDIQGTNTSGDYTLMNEHMGTIEIGKLKKKLN